MLILDEPNSHKEIHFTNEFNCYDTDEFLIGGIFYNDSLELAYFIPFFREKKFDELKYYPSSFILFCWDKKKNDYYLLRDRQGLIPFYYTVHNDGLYIGTNIQTVLSLSNAADKPNAAWCFDYIIGTVGKFNDLEYTFYESIKRIPPGSLLNYSQGDIKITEVLQYNFENEIKYKRYDEYIEHFAAIFEEGIKALLGNNRRIGIELSGGLDSASILGVSKKHIDLKDILCYSHVRSQFQHVNQRQDEREKIEETMNLLGIDRKNTRFITREKLGVNELYKHAFSLKEGLSAFHFAIFNKDIYREAQKDNIKIMFSGLGGDHCVSHRYIQGSIWGKIPYLKQLYQEFHLRVYPRKKLDYFLNIDIQPFLNDLKELIPDLQYIDTYNRVKSKLFTRERVKNIKSKLLKEISSNSIIGRVEATYHAANYHGLKYAYPMLYPKLIEFILRLPQEILIHKTNPRHLFRSTISKWLPPKIVNRKKEYASMYGWLRDSYKNDFLTDDHFTPNLQSMDKEEYFYSIVQAHKNKIAYESFQNDKL